MLVRVLLAAIFAGVLAGVFSTAVQSYRVIPLILEAEKHEGDGGAKHAHSSSEKPVVKNTELSTDPKAHTNAHERNAEAWAPRDGMERTLYTLLANILVGVAFSLILTSGILLTQSGVSLQSGLAWGVCGFFVFVLAPNFSLSPELPGMAAAGVRERQIWWLATVVMSAAGLYLFAFKQYWPWMVLGVALLVLPHVYGAPQPVHHETAVPANLAVEFVTATIVSSALFWVFLGGLLGYFQSRALASK
ncbi:MAG: CbtA family protein [Rhizobiaceae bacterium]